MLVNNSNICITPLRIENEAIRNTKKFQGDIYNPDFRKIKHDIKYFI